ncbi:MAG: lytic murein transglycosylase [Rickettsiales bacterium]|jgi:membrane-bound lytic murein transglycosylase B|nr:lytic murein transglycosylase [Rickettsiales bacterium]
MKKVIAIIFCLLAAPAPAQEAELAAALKDAAEEEVREPNAERFSAWLADFKAKAKKKHKISESTIEAAFRNAKYEPKVIEADRRQPEFVRTFWSYYDSALSQDRIANGRLMMERHAKLLDTVSKKYNVQPHVLVAFWGMETNYGHNLGSYDVISALATLSFDERRSEFFTDELVAALKILDAGHIKPADFKGSWAGAFGNFQFLPTTFLRHGVDGDGDGRIDVFGSAADSLASAANYLSKMGWDGRFKWGRPAVFARGDMNAWRHVNSGEYKPLDFFSSIGVKAWGGGALPRGKIDASLVAPGGADGPAFVVYGNFKYIMKWNASSNYAIAVGLLSDTFVSKTMPVFARPSGWDSAKTLSSDQVREIQARLEKLGLYDSKISGIYGRKTAKAIKDYQQMLLDGNKKVSRGGAPISKYKSGKPVIPDGYPSADLYEILTR